MQVTLRKKIKSSIKNWFARHHQNPGNLVSPSQSEVLFQRVYLFKMNPLMQPRPCVVQQTKGFSYKYFSSDVETRETDRNSTQTIIIIIIKYSTTQSICLHERILAFRGDMICTNITWHHIWWYVWLKVEQLELLAVWVEKLPIAFHYHYLNQKQYIFFLNITKITC